MSGGEIMDAFVPRLSVVHVGDAEFFSLGALATTVYFVLIRGPPLV
jgi:hypothetical protein